MAEDASERVRRAREALAEVKADSLAKGNRPARIAPNNQKLAAPPDSPRGAGGRRGRRDDPQSLTSAIDGLISEQGWAQAAAVGSVFGHWAQIVGADLAAHTTPESLTDGELTIAADSTAWATQVRLLAGQLVHPQCRTRRRLGAPGEGSRPGERPASARRVACARWPRAPRYLRLTPRRGVGSPICTARWFAQVK